MEERGYWEASSVLHRRIKKLIRKGDALRIDYIRDAHKVMFTVARQLAIAGRYRRDNGPELRRIDGTVLKIADWKQIPNQMAQLDDDLKFFTANMRYPKNEQDYDQLISTAAMFSHRLASIHPFTNGNGRASRLLLSGILIRAGLPEIAVKKEKPQYLRAMRQADDGDFVPLKKIILSGLLAVQNKNYEVRRRKQAELAKYRQGKRKNK